MSTHPLSRNFYSFLILLLAVLMVSNIVDDIVGMQVGSRALTFESFDPWIVLSSSIFLIVSVTILRYLWYKGYYLAFTAGLINTVAGAFQYVVIYNLLMNPGLQKYYVTLTSGTFAAGMLYGAAMAFTGASERPWLKRGGLVAVICTSIMLITFVWVMNIADIQQRLLLEKIHRIAGLGGVMVPFAYLLNFWDESKALSVKQEQVQPVFWREFLKLTAVLAVLLFGINFVAESYHSRPNRPFVPSSELIRHSKAYPPRNYVNSEGDTLPYRLAMPVNYDSTKQYPMIVCLHPAGTHGKDNLRQLDADPAPLLLNDGNRQKYPAFVFMPHCPEGASFARSPGYPSADSLTFEAIRFLQKQYPVDLKRVYVMGISGGGYGSWHFISTHPEMFAAAIPICGGGDSRFAKTLVNIPIWAFHGTKDRSVPVSGTRDIINAIKKAGGNPKYTEFEGKGHGIWDLVKDEPKLLDWLFAQSKN